GGGADHGTERHRHGDADPRRRGTLGRLSARRLVARGPGRTLRRRTRRRAPGRRRPAPAGAPPNSRLHPPRQGRGEDTFAVAAVAAWLATHADVPGTPEVRQFPGGVSNLTYLLRYPDRDLILRRPPAGTKAGGSHDMRREYDVQSLLRPAFPYVPTM